MSDAGAAGFKVSTNFSAGVIWSRTSATWEPPDSVKGDIARALFYIAVRYTGDVANEPRLTLTDNTSQITATKTMMGRYTTLLKWHFADPVSATEQARNEGVFTYQMNRNPFVDHPEWVARAFIPQLSIGRTGTNLWLYWTNDYTPSFSFDQSTNLGAAWAVLTNAPTLTTNTWSLAIPLDSDGRFFRVRLE